MPRRPQQHGRDHRALRGRWLVVAVVAVGAVAAVAVVTRGDDDPDQLAVFCVEAADELDGLAGDGQDREAALDRLSASAPDDLGGLVDDAAAAPADTLPEDLFVVPGDANSAVRADVAAEMWAEQATSTQAWSRVEQVLVGECGLQLDESGGEG